jgi:hypothetical protein
MPRRATFARRLPLAPVHTRRLARPPFLPLRSLLFAHWKFSFSPFVGQLSKAMSLPVVLSVT